MYVMKCNYDARQHYMDFIIAWSDHVSQFVYGICEVFYYFKSDIHFAVTSLLAISVHELEQKRAKNP